MSHECPAKGCTETVSMSMLMCRPHWYMVPKALQRAVYAAYHGTGARSREALRHAQDAAIQAVDRKLAGQ